MSSSNVSLRMEKTRSGGMELGALARTKVKRYKGATVERPPDSKGRDARGNASLSGRKLQSTPPTTHRVKSQVACLNTTTPAVS